MARTKRAVGSAIPAAGSEDNDALDVGTVTALLSVGQMAKSPSNPC